MTVQKFGDDCALIFVTFDDAHMLANILTTVASDDLQYAEDEKEFALELRRELLQRFDVRYIKP